MVGRDLTRGEAGAMDLDTDRVVAQELIGRAGCRDRPAELDLRLGGLWPARTQRPRPRSGWGGRANRRHTLPMIVG
jgi:hypothetical protein